MRSLAAAIALGALWSLACTRRDPAVCCENDVECTRIGTREFSFCEIGACVGNLCVERGTCDGNEDCASPATCEVASCIVPPDANQPATCALDASAQCRQIMAHYCGWLARCHPADPAQASQCSTDTEAVCSSNHVIHPEVSCQKCRAELETSPCDARVTAAADDCLRCYSYTDNPNARCPNP